MRWGWSLLAACSLAGGGPALAVAPAGQAQAAATDDQIQRFYLQIQRGQFREALATAEAMSLPSEAPEATSLRDTLRATALLGLKRDDEARRLFVQAEQRAPKISQISIMRFVAGMVTGRLDEAAAGLDRLLAAFGGDLKQLDDWMVWQLLHEQPEGSSKAADDRRVALVRAGFGGENGDGLTTSAIAILLKRGDLAGAAGLLRFVDDPQSVENMLVLRRYAALWPRVEERAGPKLANVRQASVVAARNAHAAKQDDESLHQLINALRHAGELEEAVALRAQLPAGAALRSATEEQAWGINNVALALAEADRFDEADQLFASLNNSVDGVAGWLISMKINRLELLVASGRFDRALPLLAPTVAAAKTSGNAYARQLVRRLSYCIYARLGRQDQAAAIRPEVLQNAKDANAATIDGLVCAGDIAQAEKVLLAALPDAAFQESMVRQLQPVQLTSDDPSVWAKGWKELRARPAVMEAYRRYGRDMPPAFLVRPVP